MYGHGGHLARDLNILYTFWVIYHKESSQEMSSIMPMFCDNTMF